MKNVFKLFGIIALVAAIGFSMVACEDGVGGGGGGGGGGSGSAGTLTITGLPQEGRNWHAYVYSQSVTISSGYADWPDNYEAWDMISPGEGNTFRLTHRVNGSSVRWTGSGSWTVTMHHATVGNHDYIGTVNFSNGSATVPFSSFRQITD